MSPEAARRAATERLGDLTRVREECAEMLKAERRADDRRVGLSLSWLDVKLGLRMLRRFPVLSLVSVIGMAVAIAIGAGYFGFFSAMLNPVLPFEGGDRIVSIRNSNPVGWDGEFAFDFLAWRDMKSVRDLGAYRDDNYNLITRDGRTEVAPVAAITTAGFRLPGVQAIMGRTLLPEDEKPGAPAVIVIGQDEWRRRFHAASDVLGQTVRVGDHVYTIVGVMPSDFRFPVRHQYWIPLSFDATANEPGFGRPIRVFGRLADGFSIDQARAEVEQIGRRLSQAHPKTHEHMRPQLMPYTAAYLGVDSPETQLTIRVLQSLIGLLLVVVAVNISILIYARTATRMGEIATRTALGASRRRIITQLFVEALVLSSVAAAIGLTLAANGLRLVNRFGQESTDWEAPFWLNVHLSPSAIVYAVGLTLLAAAIVGVVPALKATGKQLGDLRRFSSRGAGMRLGSTWTALIVIQVGIAVAALPHALNYTEQSVRAGLRKPAVAADGLLRGLLVMNRDGWSAPDDEEANAKFRDRLFAATHEVMRRLEREPGVAEATFAARFPGEDMGLTIERDSSMLRGGDTAGVRFAGRRNDVALNLLEVFRVPVLAGRGFTSADTLAGSTAVIVDDVFAKRIGASVASVIGQRIRYASQQDGEEPSRWYEIVGVVSEFANNFSAQQLFDADEPLVLHALSPSQVQSPPWLVVRVASGNPVAFAGRVAEIAASTDANLRVDVVEPVVQNWNRGKRAYWALAIGVLSVTMSVLLLSAAGIYAMMSFTVARRRREIGIRAALGADARRVFAGVFGRASAQLGAGVLAGLTITGIIELATGGDKLGARAFVLLPSVVVVIVTIGLLAALGPVRRGLSVQPTEVMREE
jgi:predicted permease